MIWLSIKMKNLQIKLILKSLFKLFIYFYLFILFSNIYSIYFYEIYFNELIILKISYILTPLITFLLYIFNLFFSLLEFLLGFLETFFNNLELNKVSKNQISENNNKNSYYKDIIIIILCFILSSLLGSGGYLYFNQTNLFIFTNHDFVTINNGINEYFINLLYERIYRINDDLHVLKDIICNYLLSWSR
jgi:hypothetical protein